MRDFTEEQLAKMWCQLNCWETPTKIVKENNNRPLNRAEFGGAMRVIEMLVPKSRLLEEWNRKPRA